MTVKYFNVKNGLTTGNISLDSASGNIVGTNLSVTGVSTLGNIGNVKITGGTSGQAVITDGSGNLSFTTITVGSPAPMPYYIFPSTSCVIPEYFQGLYSYPITIDGDLEIDGILIQV